MVEEEFIKKILNGAGTRVPDVCQKAFEEYFSDAINPEWFLKTEYYEVLFQKHGIEYIAEFDLIGDLIKYKMYLENKLLPSLISSVLERDWEIMNAVLINERNHISYEIIVRSSALVRSLVIIDQFGKILEERSL